MQGCKRLIENSVICWNYLYLSRLLINSTKVERTVILEMLPRTSPGNTLIFNRGTCFIISKNSSV